MINLFHAIVLTSACFAQSAAKPSLICDKIITLCKCEPDGGSW